MHGFNQGYSLVRDLCLSEKPDIYLLQEHWTTPDNFTKFDNMFPGYFVFGSSAMSSSVESGIIRGRPFGGIAMLINNNLQKFTRTVYSADRCVIVKLFDYLLVNVYLPCSGTLDRLLIIEDIFNELTEQLSNFSDCVIVIGGDWNCELDSSDDAAVLVNNFFNDALYCSSCIDYFVISNIDNVIAFNVIDHGANLSDHLPIAVLCQCEKTDINCNINNLPGKVKSQQTYSRWDYADINSYYLLTGQYMQPLLNDLIAFESNCASVTSEDSNSRLLVTGVINSMYENIVRILNSVLILLYQYEQSNFTNSGGIKSWTV